MKKILVMFGCILFNAGVYSQAKYTVPVRTVDEKHQNLVFQLYMAGFGGGVNFAKAHGTTPYEYGAYLGKLFAPGWGAPNNFDALVKGWLVNLEDSRVAGDPAIVVQENQDGSVSITASEQMLHKYFPDGNEIISFNEYLDCMRGIFTEIGNYLGAKVNIDNKDGVMVFTYIKK
ncbi:MAG TPA: hypothetical protein VK207_00445 [Bacteroidales bacterium]|nr:hypothetical protein [Bacteroidales bacterium]